ncbi:CheB methylesterase domain-containing protein [Cellulosilyticum ruminicola]|uniref:CheB methylesterase domain-containing protein n=1 Tax=Cellulosilyticum ruminicola TaxID=425254 RepID=UPI0006D2928C|nr:CheB methylesterase domain-containing protein [Cellulosilyticum ruminicola]
MSTDINHRAVYKEEYEYIVAMGISTGGPKLLSQIIQTLDESVSATYIVVQHMPPGFTKTLAERLNTMTKLTVKEAVDNEMLKRGVVYIAPGGKQLKINDADNPYIMITDEAPYKGHRPAVNIMMNALAQLKRCRKKYIAIIMTGMGSDGLEGIMNLKKNKTCTVIAQDEATCTVYGMPKAVINAGLADYICPGYEITKIIKKIAGD